MKLTLVLAALSLMISNLALAQWRPGPDNRPGPHRPGPHRPGPDNGWNRPQQACFFEDDNFQGRSFCINSRATVYNLRDSGFNDRISSASIPRGMRVVVFEDANFQGQGLELSGDVYSISAYGRFWNDKVSSMYVR